MLAKIKSELLNTSTRYPVMARTNTLLGFVINVLLLQYSQGNGNICMHKGRRMIIKTPSLEFSFQSLWKWIPPKKRITKLTLWLVTVSTSDFSLIVKLLSRSIPINSNSDNLGQELMLFSLGHLLVLWILGFYPYSFLNFHSGTFIHFN